MCMTQHIGIAAGSAEGAALCYLAICREGSEMLGRFNHPEITLHNRPLGEYMRRISTGDWDGVARLLLDSARIVAGAGADFLICPDSALHRVYDAVRPELPIPWIHIADVVVSEALDFGYRTVGILGDRRLLESPVYSDRLDAVGIRQVIPVKKDLDRVNRIMFDELVYGRYDEGAQLFLSHLVDHFRDDGCDAVILGGSELSLVLAEDICSLPLLDSGRLLARRALRTAVELPAQSPL